MSASGSGQASSSGARPAQKQTLSSSPSGQAGKKKKNRKGKAPFSFLRRLAALEVKAKEPERSRLDGTTLPVRVGGCLAPHWRRWQAIGAESWVVTGLRDNYRVPFLDSPPPLSRTPVSFPTYRAGSPRAQALRQEVEAMLAKGALEIARDPGPGFYSRLFLVEKTSGSWRPVIDLSPERVRLADSVQDGNSRFCTVICQRGGFSCFPGSEGCVLSDPNPSICEEAIEVHIGGDGLPVPSPVFRTVDCSPGLHQGLRSRVSVGTLMGSDFSAIWTTGWFFPPQSGKPNRPSSRSSRFFASLGL